VILLLISIYFSMFKRLYESSNTVHQVKPTCQIPRGIYP